MSRNSLFSILLLMILVFLKNECDHLRVIEGFVTYCENMSSGRKMSSRASLTLVNSHTLLSKNAVKSVTSKYKFQRIWCYVDVGQVIE
jgi:hypothetical protein